MGMEPSVRTRADTTWFDYTEAEERHANRYSSREGEMNKRSSEKRVPFIGNHKTDTEVVYFHEVKDDEIGYHWTNVNK